ncbi:MAG: Rieske 2Fe-2S domain-containing protein [Acidimicrobiia bacterium]|nr:Rieske 2Fe-2S domain-containing protein [Acidimicrobiia bacterium]
MDLHSLAEKLGKNESLDGLAEPGASAVKKVIGRGAVKDLLSGTWLGHPLHPLLTDIPIGAFTGATVLDLIGGRRAEAGADALVGVGVLSTLPTALAGAADWSETYGDDQRVGVVHALANVAGLACFAISLSARRRGRRGAGKVWGLAGMSVMSIGGYLGGYLSYGRGVGVNNAFFQHEPEDWTAVAAEAELSDGKPMRVEANGATALLYRSNGRIYAIGSRCSHAGGPLDEGTVDAAQCTVECPWHQSVFRLEDGTVVHGPASVPQAPYDARVVDGQVEIRRRPTG